jgi:hypothetical protein
MARMAGSTVTIRFAAQGTARVFRDIDGNRYLDMNLADLAGCRAAPSAVVAAVVVGERRHGVLLPTEDAVVASERLPPARASHWQYTGSASA